jgi:HSP20 family protein
MNEPFQPPAGKKHDNDPFQRLRHMVDQLFDERPLKKMLETLDEYFYDTFSRAYIPIRVRETASEYIITALLPNVKREQILLEFHDRSLQLTVYNDEMIEAVDEPKQAYQKRRSHQQTTRTIPLPYPVKEHEIQAAFENGELVIRLPQKKKFIDIG